MNTVGEFYGEADETVTIETEYADYPVRIRYNHWSDQNEECVTQRFNFPSLYMGHHSLYEWLCKKMAEARALEEEGFVAIDSYDDTVIWSRSVDPST